jgi:hypothetical protein
MDSRCGVESLTLSLSLSCFSGIVHKQLHVHVPYISAARLSHGLQARHVHPEPTCRVQVAKLLHRSTLFFMQGSLQVRGEQRLSCCILPACTLP